MLTKKNIIDTFKNLNLKDNDNILIHSSLKSIGPIEGNAEGLLDTLKTYFKNGLVMFPMHTWSTINQDYDTLDLTKPNSCVGELPNIAFRQGFERSHHPTHSIIAYGKDLNYLKYDDNSTTPVSPNGCFGRLHEIGAKVIFIGCPLSKFTYIHSLEERFDIPDRFTNHVFTFYSKDQMNTYTYHMPKHFSTKNAHLSIHYLKLEKPLRALGILKDFKLGNANCMIVDTKECYKYVTKLLEKNKHIFDDSSEIDLSLYNI